MAARKRRFSAKVERAVREQLQQTFQALDEAIASMEIPADEQDAISIQAYLEEVIDQANKAFEMFSDEMYEVWPTSNPDGRR